MAAAGSTPPLRGPNEPALVLPLRWTVVADLPRLGRWLPEVLEWPESGRPIVACEKDDRPWPAARAEGVRPDLVFAEVADGRALEALAAFGAETGCDVLAFVPPDLDPGAVPAAMGLLPSLSLVPFLGPPRAVAAAAAQDTAELVRKRAYRQLLAVWVDGLRRYEAELVALSPGSRSALPERPTMAPLSVVEDAHLAGVLGLWFTKPRKVVADLGMSYPGLRTAQDRWRDRMDALVKDVRRPATAHVLVVEDKADVARLTVAAIEALGKRGPTAFDVTVASDTKAARAHVEREGAPDLLWLDVHLEVERAGITFATWLRRRGGASVLLGKTSDPTEEITRRLMQLGALSVYTGVDSLLLARQVSDASLVSGLAREVQESERRVVERLQAGLHAASLSATASKWRRLVGWADDELAPMPGSVGDPARTLEDVRLDAVRDGLDVAGGVQEDAARQLRVTPKKLRGVMKRLKRDGGEDDDTDDDPDPDLVPA